MKPTKILVVDDEARVREMLEFRLRLFGYEVLLAANGREALALASKEQPDLVLLDVMMPELDGFQVCTRLKQGEETKGIPVVMLTARADAKDVTRAFSSGAADYVVKPYDPLVLQQKVAHNLRTTAKAGAY
jgi:CheY-like chemotaxis protein